MMRATGSILGAFLLAGGMLCGQARAEDAGQADLDKATETKLSATSLTDLNEVVRLCESALKKGLSAENTTFANQLLSSTLVQRGGFVANAIFDSMPPSPRWPDYRRVALEDLERAVKLNPAQPEALFMIARLNQLPGGDEKREKEALDAAWRSVGDNVGLRVKILLLRAATATDDAKKLADLGEAIRIAPQDPAPLRARGVLYARQGEHEKALQDFNAALKLNADYLPTLEDKVSSLAQLKRYDEALAVIAKLQKLDPDSALPLVQKARIEALKGDDKAAVQDLNEAERVDPSNVSIYLLRSMVYQEMKENEKALADAEKALKLRPDLEPAIRLRAGLLAGAGKFDLAIEQLSQLLKNDPDDVESRLQMAMFYQAENRPRKAVELYTEILQKDPKNYFAIRGRADTLLSLGKHAEAIADYEKAVKEDGEDPSVLNNFAWVLATSPIDKLRDGKRAIELATKACKLTDYKQAHILSTLAAAYAETGDFETAKKWSQKAVELGSKDEMDALKKELVSYQAGKPVREMQTPPEEPKEKTPPQEQKPAPKASEPEAGKAAAEPKKAAPSNEGPSLLPAQDAKPIKP